MERGELFLLIPLAVAVGVIARFLVRALKHGEVITRAATYTREWQPIQYWSQVAYAAIGLLLLLPVLVSGARGADIARHLPLLLAYGIVLPAVFYVVAGFRTGAMEFAGTAYQRQAEPSRYWLSMLAYLALAGASVWYLTTGFWLSDDRAASYSKTVEPVVETLREQLSGERWVSFRNIRVDASMRLVCGEVLTPNGTQRFFGASRRENSPEVTLEQDIAAFDAAYEQRCAGPSFVP